MRKKAILKMGGVICTAVALLATVFLSACTTPPATDAEEVILNIGNTTQPTTDNPFKASIGAANASHFTFMYDPLVWVMFDGTTVGRIAESWSYDDDTMTWTILLNTDVKFSNGNTVTASDVKFTYEKAFDLILGQTDDVAPLMIKKANTADTVSLEYTDNLTTADTITRTTGSFITDGWEAGDAITVSGSASNNGTYTIATITALVITLELENFAADPPEDFLTDEAASVGAELSCKMPAHQFNSDEYSDDAITAVDAATITFELETYAATFIRLLGDMVIVPESVWGDMTDTELLAYTNPDPVGSGPYSLYEREEDSHTIYAARSDYWDGKPSVDTIIRRYYTNEEAQLLALKLGQIDACSNFNLPTAMPQLVVIPEISVFLISDNTNMTLYVNHRFEPWDDKDFRNAVSIGLDRNNLVLYGADGWANMPVMFERDASMADVIAGIEWPYAGNTQAERIALANDALDDITGMSLTPAAVAGVVPAFVREFNDDPLVFDFSFASNWTEHATVAELVKADLADMGIATTMDPLHVSTLVGMTFRQSSPDTLANWQIYIWGRPFPPEYDYVAGQWGYYDTIQYSKRSSIMGWDDAQAVIIGQKFNELQALPEGDAVRDALIAETQELWAAELPAIPLYNSINPGVYRTDRFTGWITDNGFLSYGSVTAMSSVYNALALEPIIEEE